MEKQFKFSGDQKISSSILSGPEDWFVRKTIGLIPKWVETYHLTLLTLVWSGFVIYFGFLAKNFNIHWLWMVSLMIVFQYLTDLYDGKIGKLKNTGLVRWGYYMDHFLDYIFLGAILLAYSYFLPLEIKSLGFYIAIVIIAFVINSNLSLASMDKFKIYFFRFGPTEGRLVLILLNTIIIVFGVALFLAAMPWFALFTTIGLIAVIFRMQRKLWKMDMDQKNNFSS